MGKRKLAAIIVSICMLFSVPFPLTEIKAAETGSENTYLSRVYEFNISKTEGKEKLLYLSDLDNIKSENQLKNLSSDPLTINAADYQPDTEHGNDWALAIKQMIDDAKEADGPVTISFPKGTYHIYPDQIQAKELYISNTVGTDQNNKMKKIGFLFEDMQNVTVEGNGSTFMFHGKMTTFSTINSTNIKFQNLESLRVHSPQLCCVTNFSEK